MKLYIIDKHTKFCYATNNAYLNEAFRNEKAFSFTLVKIQTLIFYTIDLHFEGLKRDLLGKRYFIYLITTNNSRFCCCKTTLLLPYLSYDVRV